MNTYLFHTDITKFCIERYWQSRRSRRLNLQKSIFFRNFNWIILILNIMQHTPLTPSFFYFRVWEWQVPWAQSNGVQPGFGPMPRPCSNRARKRARGHVVRQPGPALPRFQRGRGSIHCCDSPHCHCREAGPRPPWALQDIKGRRACHDKRMGNGTAPKEIRKPGRPHSMASTHPFALFRGSFTPFWWGRGTLNDRHLWRRCNTLPRLHTNVGQRSAVV